MFLKSVFTTFGTELTGVKKEIDKFMAEFTIDEQIEEVKREIAMRERVYPRWIQDGKMKQAAADRQIAAMKSVLETLQAEKERRGLPLFR